MIPKNYGYVILAASTIGLECYLTGFSIGMGARQRYFTKEFMQENFGELHKKEFGTDAPSLGYPDSGSGFYSQKLPYKAWFELNNAQRTHYNFVEQLGIAVPMTLCAGLASPIYASILGFSYAAGRMLYTLGYTVDGPKGREYGAVVANVSLIGLQALSFYSGFRVIKGLSFAK
eukprot:CAMPEP_0114581532 /NCGR_PEP_ID=MMETSP0125-20121206/5633_1 /TAXON_ID=485358 ORGANISM="Aristerostoma sp., Strain ATCC 50986" /NCGR_SAMPLE_ID=MMETSP0125 /ASSEMBLY_ACC=CAM_ASM_000245 /LENGTH=173 /DNA_ID=CAMNT_0001773819 /DNA_START=86 /DNA_END=607 /DNA_ORIENTATION=+